MERPKQRLLGGLCFITVLSVILVVMVIKESGFKEFWPYIVGFFVLSVLFYLVMYKIEVVWEKRKQDKK